MFAVDSGLGKVGGTLGVAWSGGLVEIALLT